MTRLETIRERLDMSASIVLPRDADYLLSLVDDLAAALRTMEEKHAEDCWGGDDCSLLKQARASLARLAEEAPQ